MSIELPELLKLLDDTLVLEGRGLKLKPGSELAGSVPELDSMGAMAIVNAAEERYGITIDDEEIDGEVFATVGSLLSFLQRKTSGG